ncbi:MAG: DUF1223 domain-containing protein [Pseudomonadota bacterium]
MTRILNAALTLALLSTLSPSVLAEPTVFSSGERRVTLIELYTSQGCSSCPPADRWMRGLRNDERLWRDIVPVALHVDYWDYIGWKDHFADPEHSRRQRNYARVGAASTVYTPGFFTNGAEWAGWFRNRNPELPGGTPGVLDVSVESNEARILFSPSAVADERLHVYVAVLGMGLETEINAGENRGRKLKHDFVALHLDWSRMQSTNGKHIARVPLPSIESDAERLSIAVWVTAANGTDVLQSTGGYL